MESQHTAGACARHLSLLLRFHQRRNSVRERNEFGNADPELVKSVVTQQPITIPSSCQSWYLELRSSKLDFKQSPESDVGDD